MEMKKIFIALALHSLWMVTSGLRSPISASLKNDTAVLSNLMLGIDGWVQGNDSRAVFP